MYSLQAFSVDGVSRAGDFEHETPRVVHFFALNDICHVSAQLQ